MLWVVVERAVWRALLRAQSVGLGIRIPILKCVRMSLSRTTVLVFSHQSLSRNFLKM